MKKINNLFNLKTQYFHEFELLKFWYTLFFYSFCIIKKSKDLQNNLYK